MDDILCMMYYILTYLEKGNYVLGFDIIFQKKLSNTSPLYPSFFSFNTIIRGIQNTN